MAEQLAAAGVGRGDRVGLALLYLADTAARVLIGERLGVPMPATQTVYACAKMLSEKQSRESA